MTQLEELRLMAKVAQLYHAEGLRQADIAAQLSLSQATVSRLLKRARDEQIVRIHISAPPGSFPDLESGLRRRYGLQDAVVVECAQPDDDAEILRNLGAAAAFYLESTLKPGANVGLSSWSETLLAVVDAMHPLSQPLHAQVVQILGGMGNPTAEVHANRLTTRMAKLVGSAPLFLTAPGVVGSAEARRVLLDDAYISQTVASFDRLHVALVGIGAVTPSKLLASSGNVFAPAEIDLLAQRGAVGDLCLRFFDTQGRPVLTPLDERVIGITLDQLRRVDRCIGIAGGARKFAALRGALAGGWINVLFTDHFNAARLLA